MRARVQFSLHNPRDIRDTESGIYKQCFHRSAIITRIFVRTMVAIHQVSHISRTFSHVPRVKI